MRSNRETADCNSGHEFGVWGRACSKEGSLSSLIVLEEIATECAGLAACLHFAGLAALELQGAAEPHGPCAVALFDRAWRPDWEAMAAKLRITLECDQAVTDCLQVLGGYGYMEDYRMEKRLRDSLTLKAMAIEPNNLRLLCAASPGRES